MIDPTALRQRVRPIDRSSDRLVALVSIALAIAFLGAALASTLLPADVRLGAWLPLHLALAGGATTAIAGVMPFFSAALAAAPPIDSRLRLAAVLAVAVGAAGVTVGISGARPAIAAASGALFILGALLTGWASIRPLGRGLGPSRGLVTKGYLAAILSVVIGASVATLYVGGVPAVAASWERLRPAHAWLNVVGFVSVVIATTLLHFFPTVVGARIVGRRSAQAAVVGLVGGAFATASGFALAGDLLARVGAVVAFAGAVALVAYAGRTWRARAGWRTDAGWHVVAMGGLASAIGWFAVGMAIAAGSVLVAGADPAGWSAAAAAAPLVVGWAGLAIVASATHLLPAVGPGDQAAHARQRRLLGRVAAGRLVAMNAGIAVLTVGLPLGDPTLTAIGVALVGLGFGATIVLLGVAIAIGGAARTPTG